MDELQTIRDALEYANSFGEEQTDIYSKALAALSRLEALAAEVPDAKEIIDEAMNLGAQEEEATFSIRDWKKEESILAARIGQYAYRYSEDIRKDRDYWKNIVESCGDIIQASIENHKPNGWQDACPNCGDSPLRLEARSRNGSASASADCIAVCQNCKRPMPEGWHSIHGQIKIPGPGE